MNLVINKEIGYSILGYIVKNVLCNVGRVKKMLLAQNPMTSFVMGIIAVGIVISVLLIQISLNKRRNYLLEELLTEADVSNKRFRAVMQYIPCDILQFDLYDEKLYIIERQSGDKVEIPLHDSAETRGAPASGSSRPPAS